MAAANDEFFVKFKYWLVVGGIIILKAWGIITSLSIWLGFKPTEAAASFWPLLIPWIPALTHSATKVAVYKDRASTNANSSGGTLIPSAYIKDVFDNNFTENFYSNDKWKSGGVVVGKASSIDFNFNEGSTARVLCYELNDEYAKLSNCKIKLKIVLSFIE